MNIKKMIGGLSMTAFCVACVAQTSYAQQPMANISLNQSGTIFTFNTSSKQLSTKNLAGKPGVEGTQTFPTTQNIFFAFGPITETTAVVNNSATFSGGNFTVYGTNAAYSAAPADLTTLLTGNFANSMVTVFGSTGFTFSLNDVNYTGGSDLTAFQSHYGSGSSNGGSLTVSFGTVSPAVPIPFNGTKFPAFNVASPGTATFNAPGTPEPSSVAAFACTAIGLLGLMLRARKGRRVNDLAV